MFLKRMPHSNYMSPVSVTLSEHTAYIDNTDLDPDNIFEIQKTDNGVSVVPTGNCAGVAKFVVRYNDGVSDFTSPPVTRSTSLT
jgi:hypothetical protein